MQEQKRIKYLKRQMMVEHQFGTIKRTMNAGYFLTRGIESVTAETALVMLSYNLKRVINIIGVKELIRKMAELRPVFLPKFNLSIIRNKINSKIALISINVSLGVIFA
ncbi:MAG: hypothetical protein COA82_11820 [Alkaliphilus sp.]|nr:MAG: hypothetical protein COA82_11820 [Alkaliphilus sp.]